MKKKFELKKLKQLLHSACHEGRIEEVQQLLNENPRLNPNCQKDSGWTPLLIACHRW